MTMTPVTAAITALATLVGALLAASPAPAFERIEKLVAALPPKAGIATGGEIMRYVGSHPESLTRLLERLAAGGIKGIGTGHRALDAALSKPRASKELTGLAIDQVLGVLSTGDPPDDILALVGPDGFAAGAPAAFASRGFERRPSAGLEMYAFDKDYAVELSRRTIDDPFGGLVGAAQRIILLGDRVVAARATVPAQRSAIALAAGADCPACGVLRVMLAAVKTKAAPRSHVRAASAYGAATFLGGDDPLSILEGKGGGAFDPSEMKRRADAAKGPRQLLPSFRLAVLMITAGPDGEASHIALAFADKLSAEAAVKTIADRLAAATWKTARAPIARGRELPNVAGVETAVVDGEREAVGIVTLRYTAEPPFQSAREYAIWTSTLYNRDFWPIRIFE